MQAVDPNRGKVQMATRVEPVTAEQFSAIAERNHRTIADELRVAIAEHVKREARTKGRR